MNYALEINDLLSLIGTDYSKRLLGQQAGVTLNDPQTSLKQNNIPFDMVFVADDNDEIVLNKNNTMSQKYIICSGHGGVILNKSFFNLDKEILHVHGGKLSYCMGSTTGSVLHMKNFPYSKSSQYIDYEYDSRIRTEVLVEQLKST